MSSTAHKSQYIYLNSDGDDDMNHQCVGVFFVVSTIYIREEL